VPDAYYVDAGMAEQHHNDKHDHDEPYEAVSAATIIASAIAVIPPTARRTTE